MASMKNIMLFVMLVLSLVLSIQASPGAYFRIGFPRTYLHAPPADSSPPPPSSYSPHYHNGFPRTFLHSPRAKTANSSPPPHLTTLTPEFPHYRNGFPRTFLHAPPSHSYLQPSTPKKMVPPPPPLPRHSTPAKTSPPPPTYDPADNIPLFMPPNIEQCWLQLQKTHTCIHQLEMSRYSQINISPQCCAAFTNLGGYCTSHMFDIPFGDYTFSGAVEAYCRAH